MRYPEKHKTVLENCDGYSYVSDEEMVNDYKKAYHWVKRDDKILFPFIYNVIYKTDYGLMERCIINIPRKKYIEVVDGKKFIR